MHGLMNRGGSGGTTDPSPDVPGTISGFRPQGVPIAQNNIAAQQRAHVSGGSTAAMTGSTRTLKGLNEGHQPRDRAVRSRFARTPYTRVHAAATGPATVSTGSTVARTGGYSPVTPAATVSPATPATVAPAKSGEDVYRELVNNVIPNGARPRERSPPELMDGHCA